MNNFGNASVQRPVENFVVNGATPKAKITYSQEFSGGFEYEAARSLNLGIRYVHRTIPRVLEDSSAYPLAAYDLGQVPNGGNVEPPPPLISQAVQLHL